MSDPALPVGSTMTPSTIGTTPPPAAMAGSGAIEPPPPSTGVTYHKDIRPLIEQNCTGCHIAGGVGPFPLDT